MKPVLSPKELATAIGVSESSLKRWADDGLIRVARTAGGHRRIPIAEAIRFIRETKTPLVRPEVLGFTDLDLVQADTTGGEEPADLLYRYLAAGQAPEARGLVMSLYLSGQTVAALADGPVRSALERLGRLWEHHENGVFIEHRATDICMEALWQLHTTLEPRTTVATAVGGAIPGDPYILASLLAATVLAAEGYHAVNLGPNTPFEALRAAVDHHKATLAWLSFSHVPDRPAIEAGARRFAQEMAERGVRLVVGGQSLGNIGTALGDKVFVGRSMAELAAFANGVLASRAGAPAPLVLPIQIP